MATEIISNLVHFLLPMLGISFFLIAKQFQDQSFGFLSGIIFLLFGVAVLIDPIPGLSSLMNDVTGHVGWGIGAYILVRGSLEAIQVEEVAGA